MFPENFTLAFKHPKTVHDDYIICGKKYFPSNFFTQYEEITHIKRMNTQALKGKWGFKSKQRPKPFHKYEGQVRVEERINIPLSLFAQGHFPKLVL